MGTNRSKAGDEKNTAFELPEFRKGVTPGFHRAEEPSDVAEGQYRIRRRRKQEDIPRESLAERIRRDRRGG